MTFLNQDSHSEIPDVAKNITPIQFPLDEVGMDEVFIPVTVNTSAQSWQLGGYAKISIDLVKAEARGIHMSRLYLIAHEILSEKELSADVIREVLQAFVESQDGLCHQAFLDLRFELPLLRDALITDFKGWKSYPVTLSSCLKAAPSSEGQDFHLSVNLAVDYSSTCPCSAALSRRFIRDKFLADHQGKEQVSLDEAAQWFDEKGLAATPHGQRSRAFVNLVLVDSLFPFESLIGVIEGALTTPTQTAVKRLDEQRFAVLSAQNVMFAEDAARRVAVALHQDANIKDFDVSVYHYESLHSHDAFARTSKSSLPS
ncbi:MAG: GTP cyclohydrolase FolE2 [Proteobacteria bacterium]|nr:GTP cyclohydrolase FolE2 [Pseudomonadota bacterium]